MLGLSIVTLCTAGCRMKTEPRAADAGDGSADQSMPEPQPDDVAAVEPEEALPWKHHDLEEQGIGFDLMLDVEISSGIHESVHYLSQYTEPVQILILYGGDITLKSWREGYGNWQVSDASEVEPTTVCGVSAQRQTLFQQGTWAEGGFVGPDGEIEFRSIREPDMVRVAAAFAWRETPVVAVWTVMADKREGHRHNEEHFFASIRCTPVPAGETP